MSEFRTPRHKSVPHFHSRFQVIYRHFSPPAHVESGNKRNSSFCWTNWKPIKTINRNAHSSAAALPMDIWLQLLSFPLFGSEVFSAEWRHVSASLATVEPDCQRTVPLACLHKITLFTGCVYGVSARHIHKWRGALGSDTHVCSDEELLFLFLLIFAFGPERR